MAVAWLSTQLMWLKPLTNQCSTTVIKIAKALLLHDPSQTNDYAQIIKHMLGRVLTNHVPFI
jgi:hypothetical protein